MQLGRHGLAQQFFVSFHKSPWLAPKTAEVHSNLIGLTLKRAWFCNFAILCVFTKIYDWPYM